MGTERGGASGVVEVAEVIDHATIGVMHWQIILLCGLVFGFDGFDTQAIAFVAPAIADAWHVPVTGFGPVFAAGLFGLMIGALFMGPLADRFGRKTLVVAATVLFGVFSLATPLVATPPQLIALRFLTGLGLGGAMPNLIALTAEYMPLRRRTMLVTLMSCGFAGGGLIGGIAAAAVVPAWGWQGMFYLGGALPLLLAVALVAWLPESIRFIAHRANQPSRVARLLHRLTGAAFDPAQRFVLAGVRAPGVPVALLFRDGRTPRTLLLWLLFVMNFLVTFSLINWLPAVIRAGGAPMGLALTAVILLNLGTLCGVGPAWLADRHGSARVAAVTFALAAVCLVGIGLATGEIPLVLGLCFLVGLFNNGTTFIANALAAAMYPTAMRSSGVGWALGMGRFGSIAGPLAAGAMLAAHVSLPSVFLMTACADGIAALAAVGLVLLGPGVMRPAGGVRPVAEI